MALGTRSAGEWRLLVYRGTRGRWCAHRRWRTRRQYARGRRTRQRHPPAGSNPPGGAGDSAPKGSGSPHPKGADVGGKEGLKLRDAAEGFDDQQAEAYDRGRAIFRPGIGAIVRDVHIYNTYTSAISARNVAPGPGPVRHDVLVATRRRYAQVDGSPR